MPIQPFDYYAPQSLPEAVALAARLGANTKIVAGGTDLVPALKARATRPEAIISLHALMELNYIKKDGGRLKVGAMTPHADLADSALVKDTVPILAQACRLVGSWQIRNTATIGGNLCNASPVADTAGPLYVLNASVVLHGPEGEREVGIEKFFTGPGTTDLKSGELLKEVCIPLPAPGAVGCYLKLMRRKALDLALVGVAIQVTPDVTKGTLDRVAIALGGVAPTPIRVPAAETLLTGLSNTAASQAIAEAAKLAVAASTPISDVRASAAYRRMVTETYVAKGLTAVFETLQQRNDAS